MSRPELEDEEEEGCHTLMIGHNAKSAFRSPHGNSAALTNDAGVRNVKCS